MKNKIYKLEFKNGVHFGSGSLESNGYSLYADTIFSALCLEALKFDKLDEFIKYAYEDKIKISDAFPYIGSEYYLPKPLIRVEHNENQGDSKIKKLYKKMLYVPVKHFDDYLNGTFPEERLKDLNDGLGVKYEKTSVSIRGEKRTQNEQVDNDEERDTLPYRIGIYYFNKGCGLYIIAQLENDAAEDLLDTLFTSLSYQGIGGKKNSGIGRFTIDKSAYTVPSTLQELLNRSTSKYEKKMLLSCALPTDSEIDEVINADATYAILKRSGFIDSSTYATQQMRKNDLYVIKSGSCVPKKFDGDIYDVSDKNQNSHPVYRYAKPMFMEV